MNRTDKLIIEYLDSAFGENPEFVVMENTIYNPYTFSSETRKIYILNERTFCKFSLSDEIEFDDRLLKTILLLFDTELDIIHRLLEGWFNKKTSHFK